MDINVVSVAGQVAAALGDGWAATNGHWSNRQDAFLVNRKAIGRIHMALRDGRLQIGGSLPEGWNQHAPQSWMSDAPEDPRISVAPYKAPGKIAGDITRRFLPGWQEYVAWTEARKKRHDEYEANVRASAENLARMVTSAKVDAEAGEIDLYGVPGVSYGSVRVHESGGLRIDRLSLTPEGAKAFFRALGKLSE
jgi:hypothetical protein